MRAFGDSFSDLDLKCDFPARESFREALLARLLAIDDQKPQEAPIAAHVEPYDSDFHAQELSDSELDMLAAAGNQFSVPDEWLRKLQ